MPIVLATLANLAVFALVLAALARWARRGGPLATRVLAAVAAGAAAGALLQLAWGAGSPVVDATLDWVDVVGTGYVHLLQLLVAPLVLVSVLAAVTGLRSGRALGAIGAGVVAVLLATTAAAALVGVGVARAFTLRADAFAQGARELQKGAALVARTGEVDDVTVPALLRSLVPTNLFADLAGARPTSVAGVALVAVLLGLAVVALRTEEPEIGERLTSGVATLQRLVLRFVRLVLRLTPYGVVALTTRALATARWQDVAGLGAFVVASYAGLALILVVHAALLAAAGTSPRRHFRESWPVLTFAFTSRSSAATIPLNVETQVARLGVEPGIANVAATLGATLGQNACAGLYPAMLAVMIAPSVGIDPATWSFAGAVVAAATIGSVGIAGVGGGATIAALVVLSTLHLPVALAGLLVSVEPLIDMGRTAVNVSGTMVAGTVVHRAMHPSLETTSDVVVQP